MNPAPRAKRSISRRRLLEIGGLGMLGLGLPQLLQARASDAGGSAPRSAEKSCILILQEGGPSQLDTWDLKPTAPAEIRGPYRPIATRTPGTQVCELMPRLAQLSDRYCIIRSMSHPHPGHPEGMHLFLSGRGKLEPASANAPYFGSVLAKLRPATRSVLSYVWLMHMQTDGVYGRRWQDGGSLGHAFAPFILGQSDRYNDPNNPASPHYRVRAFDDAAAITPDRLHERRRLLTELDAPSSIASGTAGSSYQRHQERAFDLVTGPGVRHAFAIEQEPAPLRARYGSSTLGQNLLLARRLIESGVRLVTVAAHTGSASDSPAPTTAWDMHGRIFENGPNGLGWFLPRFDEAVSALLEDLKARGLLDSTLVLALGEMGRTPRINEGNGRDHWSQSYTAPLAGAGIRGGMVYGASDRNAAYVKDNPVSPEAFAATLYQALGLPLDTRLGADGFTQPLSAGQPLLNLFG